MEPLAALPSIYTKFMAIYPESVAIRLGVVKSLGFRRRLDRQAALVQTGRGAAATAFPNIDPNIEEQRRSLR